MCDAVDVHKSSTYWQLHVAVACSGFASPPRLCDAETACCSCCSRLQCSMRAADCPRKVAARRSRGPGPVEAEPEDQAQSRPRTRPSRGPSRPRTRPSRGRGRGPGPAEPEDQAQSRPRPRPRPRRSRSPTGRRHQGQAKEREAWEASLHNRRSERSLQTKEVARVQGRGSTSVFATASGGSSAQGLSEIGYGESHASSVANLEGEELYQQQQQQQQQFDNQFSVEDFEQRRRFSQPCGALARALLRRSGGAGVSHVINNRAAAAGVTAASTTKTSNKDDGGSRVITDNRAAAGGGVNVDRSRAVVCKSVPDVGEPAPELFGDGDTVMDAVSSESDPGPEPGSDTRSESSVCDSFEADSTDSDVDNPSRDVFGQPFEIDGENADGLGNADCHTRGEGDGPTTLSVDRKRRRGRGRGAISAAAAIAATVCRRQGGAAPPACSNRVADCSATQAETSSVTSSAAAVECRGHWASAADGEAKKTPNRQIGKAVRVHGRQVTKRRRRVPAVSARRRISKKRRQTPEDTCPRDRRSCVRLARVQLGLPVKKAAIPAKPLGKAVPNLAASEHIAMTQNTFEAP